MSTPTTRHFLNALRRSPQLAPPKRGTWKQDSEFLQRYAADIDIQGQVANTEMSHSVPSVFQRPIQFYRSLASSNNPLHDAVTQEWRGLMAVFALAGWLELQLDPRLFEVPPAPTSEGDKARTPASEVGRTGNDSLHLDTILQNQAPNNQDWNEWFMIYCDGALLGATSPWTIVYTASQYRAPDGIPWQRDGRLIDPIQHYDPDKDLLPYELAILYAWISLTLRRRNQWQMPGRLGVQANGIANALQSWMAELAHYADPALTRSLALNGSLFTDPMLAGILQQPAGLPGGHSDLLLQSSKPADRPAVVLSAQLPPDRRVYRGVFVRDVDIASLNPSGHEFLTRSGRRCEVDYVVAEELFLPDRLVELQYSDSAYQPSSLQLSVPLTPAFFRYFDHFDLVSDANRLAISKIGQTFKVALRLPVSGGTLTVERVYTEQEIVRLPSKTPGFAVWPDFCTSQWKENFAAYAGPEGSDLVVTPVFGNADQPGDQARSDAHQRNVRIWPCEKPCIGFALKLRNGPSGDIDAGLVLRKDLPPVPRNNGLTWQMGVDFGTSSTTIMVSRNGAPPELMPLKGRTIFLTEPESEASGSLGAIANSLYPSAKGMLQPPLRTLLYDSAATVFEMRASNYTLRFASDAAEDGTNRPLRNVKWGHQPAEDGKSPMMAYLTGLVRYLACEAMAAGVHRLDLWWSYPLSLPDGAFHKMQNFWTQQVARRYSIPNGMTVTVVDKMSESEAICRCLGAPRQNPILNIRANCLCIAVDIGGGSTDIAMWSAQNLLDQYSFKVAGNDILDDRYLRPESLQAIFEACWKKNVPPEQIKNILGSPEVYVNSALTGARDDMGAIIHDPHNHPLPMHIHGGHEDVVPWLHFRSMNYLCFTGLAYYLGTHTRIFDLDLEDIEIYIGGRGSAGLTWLAADSAIAHELLTDAFRQGLNSNIKVGEHDPVRFRHREKANIRFLGSAIEHQSNYPPLKTEVASGLLANLKLVVNPEPGVRLGEVGWRSKNNQQLEPWEQRFTAKDMAELNPPQNFESCHIVDFLMWLRNDSKRFLTRLNLDAENLKRLWPQKASIQNQIRESADEQEHVLQPIFGFEIKSLMQQYAQLVSQSAGARKAS